MMLRIRKISSNLIFWIQNTTHLKSTLTHPKNPLNHPKISTNLIGRPDSPMNQKTLSISQPLCRIN
jgi:hypothetical protein